MAKGIHDLGSGYGFIYTVDPNGTSIIKARINSSDSVRTVLVEGVQARSVGLNKRPTGKIRITGVTGVGSISAVTVNSINQIGAAIAYTGATTASSLAASIATAMNSYDDGAGEDYVAVSVGDTVFITGEVAIGSAHNALSAIVTNTGNMTYTTTEVNGGTDGSTVYNSDYGYRFFLDADYNSSGCAGLGTATEDSLSNAVEITDYIVGRAMNSSIASESISISSGSISPTRASTISVLTVDTESAASTDDLNSINNKGFATYDIVIIKGADSGRVTTVKDNAGNIQLTSDLDFDTGNTEDAIWLQLEADGSWYELGRTSSALGATADYRTAGFGFFGIETYNTAATATSGTTTFNGGTDSKLQKLTGAATLTGNTTYALGTGVNGDYFELIFDSSITTSGNNLTIFGITLTDEQALTGGLIFRAEYRSAGWYSWVSPNLDPGASYSFQLNTADYTDDSVTVAKVESNLEHQWKYVNVSFETSEVGDMKVTMPKCTVVSFNASVSKAIAATDDATIVPKNNAGTAMTSGTLTLTASSAIGTQFTSTPSANNTFTEGQTMTLTTAKTTAGGKAIISFRIQLT